MQKTSYHLLNIIQLKYNIYAETGTSTSFWHDVWIGDESLNLVFPHLYLLSCLKNASISQCGFWRNGAWHWNLQWRRNLFVWETELEENLFSVLNSFSGTSSRPDSWSWALEKTGLYSVGSAYAGQVLTSILDPGDLLNSVWFKGVPIKISCFLWKLFRRRIPVKVELARRNVLGDNGLECTFCINNEENMDHLFIMCSFAQQTWRKVVTVAKFQGGNAFNVIPDSVTIGGTFRAFSKESFKQLKQRIEEVITGQATVQRCNAVVNFLNDEKPFYPPTVNNDDLHEHFRYVAENLLGIDKVNIMQPMMGAEDFSFYQEVIPGYFFMLGMENPSHERLNLGHSPFFKINEDALPYGAALHASLASSYLLNYQKDVTVGERKYHDEL